MVSALRQMLGGANVMLMRRCTARCGKLLGGWRRAAGGWVVVALAMVTVSGGMVLVWWCQQRAEWCQRAGLLGGGGAAALAVWRRCGVRRNEIYSSVNRAAYS